MAKTLLGNIKTFINQCIPDYIIDSWSNTAQTGKAPSENLVKTALNSKIDTAGTGLSKSGTSLAVNFGTNTNTVAQGDHTHNNYLTSLPSHNHDDRYYTEAEIQANYAEKTHTHPLDIGTFTDLQSLITNASSGDVITLDKDYQYDSTTDSSLTTGIVIEKTITIIGNGHIIDGNSTRRAFYIKNQSDKILTLEDLRIQNCLGGNGGAIWAENSNITITTSTLQNNNATWGGAIYAYNSQVNINNTNITQNNATYDGGAIFAYNNSHININNTNITHNTANNGDDGGAIYAASNSQININNTNITHNNATNGNGGAIYTTSNSQLIMKESIVKNNTATNYANIYCSTVTTVYNCDINDISTTCYNVTNKNYLTDHQSISNYIQKSNTSGLIKNDGTIDTTTKLTSNDIINDLTTGGTTKALSAEQGKELADMIGDAITYINQ